LGVLAHDGGFSVTMYDPEIEWGVFVTREEMSELLDNAAEDGFVVDDGMNEGTINLTDAQVADLRAWALGEVAA
jgi:hypothetical protein